jgi:hypothetical protein
MKRKALMYPGKKERERERELERECERVKEINGVLKLE